MSGSEMFAYFADEFGMTANQVWKFLLYYTSRPQNHYLAFPDALITN